MEYGYEDEPTYYCTVCGSLGIVEKDGVMCCTHCGAGPEKIDVTTWEKYEEKYADKIIRRSSPYDDLSDVYDEETSEELTIGEALENGCTVMEHLQRSEATLLKIK